MSNFAQLLREEHESLLPQIERLRSVADTVGDMPEPALERGLEKMYEFLAHRLMPHAQAEEEIFYPAVGRLLGVPQATASMSRDHAEVGRLTEEFRLLLAPASSVKPAEKAKDLRRVLYGLYAVVKLHLAKEEELYAPLLERYLSEEEAHGLLHDMAQATRGKVTHDHLDARNGT
jgi:iron-sulfur cluster repair protein YtfE (RIC family)